jgi:hypothetical protein
MKTVQQLPTRRLTVLETAVLVFVGVITLIGIISSRINLPWFENVYVAEDGFVENLTLVPLLAAAVVSVIYWSRLARHHSHLFSLIMWGICLFSIFVAGEEISWGQRIFGVESSEFFQRHNAQQETNLHNLVVGGTKINRVIFSQLLTAAMALYLLVIPYLYTKKAKWNSFIDWAGIPIPRSYQTIACLALFAAISLIPSGKNAEILEGAIVHIFLLILLFPRNAHVFGR